jgi:transposase
MGKETAPNRSYTDEYKQEALRLAESVGINQAAQRLGMPASSLGNWMRGKRSGKLPAVSGATPMKGSPAELEAENNRLRRELANTKLDLEIVKKAAAYFAKESR